MLRMWKDLKQRSFLMALVITILLCVMLNAFIGPITFYVFLFGLPILMFTWPSIERRVRLHYANYRHEHGILSAPSTEYYTPPETIAHPKQDYVRHEQEPQSMY